MTTKQLDERLANDCFIVKESDFAWILLMNNAVIPWLIIVPKVDVIELCELTDEQQHQLTLLTNELSSFLRQNYRIDKLNVAAIGNVVNQLHIHVIGRYSDDYCWPGVVWGQPIPEQYSGSQVAEFETKLNAFLD